MIDLNNDVMSVPGGPGLWNKAGPTHAGPLSRRLTLDDRAAARQPTKSACEGCKGGDDCVAQCPLPRAKPNHA